MSITVNESKRIFTIDTRNTTYQMMADRHDVLLHLYYGRKSKGEMDYLLTYYDRGFSGNIYDAGNDRAYSLDALPQEYPCSGTGDYRSSALNVTAKDGVEGCDLRYHSYEIREGKYALPGLPAVYVDDTNEGDVWDGTAGAQTLEIVLEDDALGLEAHLLYGVLPGLDIITRAVRIINRGKETFHLERTLTANLDLLGGNFDLLTFYGRHGMERNLYRSEVGHTAQVIGSRRGMSSHQYNPMMILCEHDATETAGTAFAMQFVWSGGFTGLVEKDQFNQTRMQLGLMEDKFFYPVEPGESFTAPEVIMSCSTEGFSRLSNNLQRCIRKHICRGRWRDQERPILLNSWEALYMNFDGSDILELAEQAKDLGLDMLVLDDGWFGHRNDDNSSLGDWYVNEKKLGGNIGELIEDVHRLGLKFGIWYEPEMISEDSDLYREHPDWALAVPGRKPIRARNQLVLDFSRKEVVDGIYRQMCAVLDQGKVDYVKWDYNRSIADIYSASGKEPGTVLYDYILGLYSLLDRLTKRYPDLLIEGCSGGGGRFDAGMLYYTPQIWGSDNTDAIDRLRIQYGTSFGYPASAVGAHVSVSPNEQCGRQTSLETRSIVAMSGTFGYELNPAGFTQAQKREIRRQILTRRKYSDLIGKGDYYRLTSPFTDDVAAWEFVSRNEATGDTAAEVLLNAVILQIHANRPVTYVKFMGLTEGAMYRDERSGKVFPADALMQAGIPMPIEMGEYHAYQWHLVRV